MAGLFFHSVNQRPGLRWVQSLPPSNCVFFKLSLISIYGAKHCGAAAVSLRLHLSTKVPGKNSKQVLRARVLRWGAFRKSLFTTSQVLLEPVGIHPGITDHPCGAGPKCLKLIPPLPTHGKLPATLRSLRGVQDRAFGEQFTASL